MCLLTYRSSGDAYCPRMSVDTPDIRDKLRPMCEAWLNDIAALRPATVSVAAILVYNLPLLLSQYLRTPHPSPSQANKPYSFCGRR